MAAAVITTLTLSIRTQTPSASHPDKYHLVLYDIFSAVDVNLLFRQVSIAATPPQSYWAVLASETRFRNSRAILSTGSPAGHRAG